MWRSPHGLNPEALEYVLPACAGARIMLSMAKDLSNRVWAGLRHHTRPGLKSMPPLSLPRAVTPKPR